jgi:hypothetical protein
MSPLAAKPEQHIDRSLHAKQKKAAEEIAEIIYASLQQFSEEEQDRRVKDIQKIGPNAGRKPSAKSRKRPSTRASRPSRRRAVAPR